jgi:hypothetical protein
MHVATPRRLGIAVVAAIAVGQPTTALGADAAGPRLIRIDPSTAAQTVLAAGAPLSDVSSIAVGPSGTIYVTKSELWNAGLYSLTAPAFTIMPFATFAENVYPSDVEVSGSTLYASGHGGVFSFDANAPFTQKVVSPTVPHKDRNPKGDPTAIALSGSTLFGIYPGECYGIDDGNDAYLVGIDVATGSRSSLANLGCALPGGLVLAPDGSLLTALAPLDREPARIIRIDPVGGSITTVSSGGALRHPADVALTTSGDLVVADRTSGVLRIAPRTGKQSTIASGGNLNGVNHVALDANGAIYAVAPGGPAALLNASMPQRQPFSTSGIRISASCSPRCTLGYSTELKCCENATGTVARIGAKRTLRLKLNARVNRALARRLHQFRKTPGTLVLRAQDARGNPLGQEVRMRFTLTR